MTETDKECTLQVRYSGCNSFQSCPEYPGFLMMNESDAISAFNEILASGKLGEKYIHWYELRVLNKRKGEIIREWKRDVIENFAKVGATDTIPAARFGDGNTKDPSSPFTPNSTEDEKITPIQAIVTYWATSKDGHHLIMSRDVKSISELMRFVSSGETESKLKKHSDKTILLEVWEGETLVHSSRFKPF